MLRIAFPNKGRLAEDTRELFNDAGLEVRSSGERALTASLGGEFEAIFVRAQDIPEFVADGAADAGVTGWDLVRESGRPLVSHLDLGFGRCRAGRGGQRRAPASARSMTSGRRTSRPAWRRSFRASPRASSPNAAGPVEIVPVSGAAEIAPHLGIADIVVDLTSTGSTLRVNGLREIETVMTVQCASHYRRRRVPRNGDSGAR